MARTRKEVKPVSLRMDATIADRLEDFCEKTGITKTAVIEKAVMAFMDDYEKMVSLAEEKKN